MNKLTNCTTEFNNEKNKINEPFWTSHFNIIIIKVTSSSVKSNYRSCMCWNSGPQFSALFSYWAIYYRTFHFSFSIYNNTCIIFKVYKHSICSSIWLSLPYYHCRKNYRATYELKKSYLSFSIKAFLFLQWRGPCLLQKLLVVYLIWIQFY